METKVIKNGTQEHPMSSFCGKCLKMREVLETLRLCSGLGVRGTKNLFKINKNQ